MTNNNYEQRLKSIAEQSQNFNDLMNNIEPVIYEIINEDDRLLSVNKNWCYYGTWKVSIFANEYTFGEELSKVLEKISIITHDEDKDFTIADLADEIREAVEEHIYLNWY